MSVVRIAGALVAAIVVAGCHTDDVASVFARQVAPVLQRRCGASSCHGVPPNGTSLRQFHFPTNERAEIDTRERVEATRTAARRFINTTESPEFSTLLRKPIPAEFGGLPHGGGTGFRDPDDAAYVAVRAWIARERDGGEDRTAASFTRGQRFFSERVQPALRASQCMLAPCHGVTSGVPLRFDGGIGGRFGVAATLQNYDEARVHLSLAGWPQQSRLVRKAFGSLTELLPHRGGNGLAGFPSGSTEGLAGQVIQWARIERADRTNNAPEQQIDGVVFVGGPPRPGRVTEVSEFVPGTDLYLVTPPDAAGSVRNLTAALHSAPAEIRNPVVDDTGTHVAFSMRLAASEGATIWELDLGTGSARRVTNAVRLPDGSLSIDLAPAYAPDGRLWFVSNRAGVLTEHSDGWDTDLYVVEADERLTRRTWTPSPELSTTFFRYGGETSGNVAFTALRRLGDLVQGVVYRFPNDLHIEYHLQYGANLADDLTFHMRETAFGDYAAVLLDRDAVWQAGALIVVDRNMGPEIYATATTGASLPAFIHPVSYLGPYGSHDDPRPARREFSDGAYRDPSPLPDGRLVVAYVAGRVELRNRDVTPDFGIYTVSLAFDAASQQLTVSTRERLVDVPGIAETEPVAVFRNVPGVAWPAPPTGATGRIAFNGIPLLQQIVGAIGPAGARTPRDDIRSVRILGAVPVSRDALVVAPAATLFAEQRSSGATPHPAARVLAELPLETDGTMYAELDAGTAWRLQYLDARGMVVGTQHNRWFDINPGQLMRQGASPSAYDTVCAHCHGARSGRPNDTFSPVDVTARASRSLARFENDDPDRPRAPARVTTAGALASDWRTVVAPMLARSCATAGCHDTSSFAAGLTLEPRRTARYDAAYEALVGLGVGSANGFRYVDVVGASARGSFLIERMLGEELDAPRSASGLAVHRGVPAIADEQMRAVVRWIESGALYCSEGCP